MGEEKKKSYSELYAEKRAAMKEKYMPAVLVISEKLDYPIDDAFDMLKSISNGATYGVEEIKEVEGKPIAMFGNDVEVDLEELRADYLELLALSDERAKELGLV